MPFLIVIQVLEELFKLIISIDYNKIIKISAGKIALKF
ncbi:hypothetical protein bthur0013_31890 [Bacillus thuringiensis IBL 200]|nr:hypothetical protein bthur0013_31890 [Bacillus thuringiensis IBL 200]